VTYDEVVPLLVRRVPELHAAYDEHIRYYDELLPHVFFADVSRFVLSRAAASDDPPVNRCLAFLEDVLEDGDELAQELVVVSFVENIGPDDAPTPTFFEIWPKKLAEWHGRIWRGSPKVAGKGQNVRVGQGSGMSPEGATRYP
jgi:hypothetical protein